MLYIMFICVYDCLYRIDFTTAFSSETDRQSL